MISFKLPSSKTLICFQWSSAMWIQPRTAGDEKKIVRITTQSWSSPDRHLTMITMASTLITITTWLPPNHHQIIWSAPDRHLTTPQNNSHPPSPTVPPRAQKPPVSSRQRQPGRQSSAATNSSYLRKCSPDESFWGFHLWHLNYLLTREDSPCDGDWFSRLDVCIVDQTRVIHHLGSSNIK